MRLDILDVAHGACALLTAPKGEAVMIDCGSNAKTGWMPGEHLRSRGIDALEVLAITNYDEDHVRGIASVLDNVEVRRLWRNRSVSAETIRDLKRENQMGAGIARLVAELENRSILSDLWFGPFIPALKLKYFWNRYPKFEDENNLSMVAHLKCHGVGVLFPGDLLEAGRRELMKRADFKQALAETDILVASHHGRDNGCCQAIFDHCRPQFIVISDKSYMHETQDTVGFYGRAAVGGRFKGDQRRVLTTRKDGTITFDFPGDVQPAARRVPVWMNPVQKLGPYFAYRTGLAT